jgi:SOS-response transcriptional repressor LexA
MNTQLTPRQYDVLSFIVGSIHSGLVPTVREIGKALGMSSTNAVAGHLNALERKGMLLRTKGRNRSLEVTSKGMAEVGLEKYVQVPESVWHCVVAYCRDPSEVSEEDMKDAVGEAVAMGLVSV